MQRRPHILGALISRRVPGLGVTLCAVAIVLAKAFLPAAHVHQSLSGEPIAHAHLAAEPADHADSVDHEEHGLDHGDHHHHDVLSLAQTYIVDSAPVLVAALVLLGTAFVPPPDVTNWRYATAFDAPVIHGPPVRVTSLRAPPAFAA